jgi:NADH-quinone oxidoreductase subunit G
MPKIIIDDREIEVAAGTKVIEAAEKLGIMIPRFCYHPALGSVGACRVCAVKFLQGPLKGVQMSCMTDAKDGMVVSTTDPEAVRFRKYVIEWFMLHHPHDCPVCDEGGHCLLQDMTVSGGHGMRRYAGSKRTYTDQYLGPLLQHEMNRCIHCYRCARFYQEFSGYSDLGAMQSANRTYFGRFDDGVLQSPFSGNLSDICPTGVYTDKPSRFFGRRWDYERSPSLCINCSLGCHTTASSRYRQVVRQEARFSSAVNGYFICDRGRYGFFYAGHKQRPWRASIDGDGADRDRAIEVLQQRLKAVKNKAGTRAIACAGSLRNSVETQALLKRICELNGWPAPVYFVDNAILQKVQSAIFGLKADLAVSLREIESADFVVGVGVDPVNEAPMLALALRQAQRTGAAVAIVDPRPIFLPLAFEHLVVHLDEINPLLSVIVKAAVDADGAKESGGSAGRFDPALPPIAPISSGLQEKISAVAEKLRISRRPIIICGTDTVYRETPAMAAEQALLLQAAGKKAGLFYVMPGANAFAAGLLSDKKASFETLIENIEQGTVQALILVESDPFRRFPDRRRLEKALGQLDLLVVMDYVDSAAAKKAHILLPTTTLYETGGVFINQEGRLQAARETYRGGIAIARTGAGGRPPRIYGSDAPGSEARVAWQILAELAEVESHPEENPRSEVWNWLIETVPGFAGLPPIDELPDDGIRIEQNGQPPVSPFVEGIATGKDPADHFELIPVEWVFGTEELSAYSECLKDLAGIPCIFMNQSDAQKLNLTDGDRLSIKLDSGAIEAKLRVEASMATGTLILPRHKDLEWQKMTTGINLVRTHQIQKLKDEFNG